jgi:hypothetical protein
LLRPARSLDPDQRARVLAAIALVAGDARVVGVSGAGQKKSAWWSNRQRLPVSGGLG